jgi:hypothetical protein
MQHWTNGRFDDILSHCQFTTHFKKITINMTSTTPLLCSLLLATTAGADLVIESVPSSAPQGFSQVFTKHVDVLGLHVYASSATSNAKVLHAARTLAQWIDNDEDGTADEPHVHATMVSLHASMIMWQTENEFEQSGAEDIIPDSVFDSTVLQLLFGDETRPGYPENQNFDASLEECLHLVTFGGYAITYPNIFGEFPGTQVADAMDANIAGGWFHYDDWTCEYDCLITEYTYWALTSMLGAQNYSWRISEITQEWELYSDSLMQTHDPAMRALLSDPQWKFATVLPDDDYSPSAPCLGDVDDDQGVGVNDLLAVISDWGQGGTGTDLDEDGTVGVNDLLIVISQWGPCN